MSLTRSPDSVSSLVHMPNRQPDNSSTQRRCYLCCKTKPLTAEFFSRDRGRIYGFCYRCKSCDKLRPKEKRPQRWKNRSQESKERHYAWSRQYYRTPEGRALALVHAYRKIDAGKGLVCTLTREWVLAEILSRLCVYCDGKSGALVGCDRVDNSGPHSPENVVPACGICNLVRGDRFSHEEMKTIGATIGEVIARRTHKTYSLR